MVQALEITAPDIFEITGPWEIKRELFDEYERLSNHRDSYFRFIAVGLVYNELSPANQEEEKSFLAELEEGRSGYRDQICYWLQSHPRRVIKGMQQRAKAHLRVMKTARASYHGREMAAWEYDSLLRMREWFEHALSLLRVSGVGGNLANEVRLFDIALRVVRTDWPF